MIEIVVIAAILWATLATGIAWAYHDAYESANADFWRIAGGRK